MALTNRQKVTGGLTATAIALAVGGGTMGVKTGFIPYWESGSHMSLVVEHQSIDPPGVYTVCDGITNLDPDFAWIRPGMKFTPKQCADGLAKILPKYAAPISECVPNFPNYPPHRQVALLSFAYNLGPGKVCGHRVNGKIVGDRIARELNAGHISVACDLMGQYISANRRVLSGLKQRRFGRPGSEKQVVGPSQGEISWCKRGD